MPNPIRSEAGQLTWYNSGPVAGLVTVNSPRTQALIGFLGTAKAGNSNLEAEVQNKFCSVQLSSLDAKPISQSSKMLLVAGGRVQNTSQRWNSAGIDVTNWGNSPTLIEPVGGTLILKHPDSARSLQLQAIDGSGQPIGPPFSANRAGNNWKLPLGRTVTTWYELTVSRQSAFQGINPQGALISNDLSQ